MLERPHDSVFNKAYAQVAERIKNPDPGIKTMVGNPKVLIPGFFIYGSGAPGPNPKNLKPRSGPDPLARLPLGMVARASYTLNSPTSVIQATVNSRNT
jgi:hypothetical protein